VNCYSHSRSCLQGHDSYDQMETSLHSFHDLPMQELQKKNVVNNLGSTDVYAFI
jgi:hypothetical protein